MMRVQHPLASGTTVPDDELWDFPEGLLGLPSMKRFAVLPITGAEPLRLLVSAELPAFGLVVVRPSVFLPGYVLELSAQDVSPLGLADAAQAEILATVVLPKAEGPLVLNLRGPIVLNPATRRGIQRVSLDDAHGSIEISREDAANATCSS